MEAMRERCHVNLADRTDTEQRDGVLADSVLESRLSKLLDRLFDVEQCCHLDMH